MQENHSNKADSIHIFDFIKIIWNGKGVLLLSVFIAIILGSIAVYTQPPVIYQSNLTYTVNIKPAFTSSDQVQKDFKNLFYTENVFDNWKANNKQNNILFKELMPIIVSGNEKEKLVKMHNTIKFENLKISIISNESAFINAIYKYTKHVNKRLSDQYLIRSEKELILFKSISPDNNKYSTGNIELYLEYDRFINSIKNGMYILNISHPQPSEALNPPRKILIYSLSIFLGLVFGFLTIFVRHELKKYRK